MSAGAAFFLGLAIGAGIVLLVVVLGLLVVARQ